MPLIMSVTKVHFGERLQQVVREKFGTQKELAKYFHSKGFLRSPNQATVSSWVQMETFKAKNIRKALNSLAAVGVNPDFFFSPLVADWRGPSRVDLDESQVLELRIKVVELTDQIEKLKAANKLLVDRLAEIAKAD